MADTRGRPTLPPYPENPETRKGKLLSPEKVQSLKARYGIDIDPPSASSGPAAPEDTYPKTAITYNQVVNNAWTAEVYYDLPDALAEGRDLGLRVFLEDGQFCVSWDTEGADLDWGAAADSMEYRAVPDSAALFGESVTGSFVMKFP
ncbi:hypothetical protein APSETT444_007849 [Aspergillus pseudonomiae]